ncbi:hypothetical protein Prum_020350 [Phytohabitans rumicis]|uniref:Uncharacterized protein n=1 Tax=Phytohabitans rumicis TaxID=1076125 RepID=A0A6V8KTF0_9ACTN|nr:hypothetical protein Prum_020350 [Phytohabitans rumicis]
MRVGEVGRDGEEPAERHGLLLEDLQGERVAAFAVRPDELGGLLDRVGRAQVVPLEPGQPVGQQVLHDAGQRGHALHVAGEPAVALRRRLPLGEQAVHRDVHVPELAPAAGRALDDPPGLDDAAAEAGAHDRGHRGAQLRVRPEMDNVRIKGGGVAVVVVDHRQPDPVLQRAADVEAVPGGQPEVRAAA